MTITLRPKYESALRALSSSQELPVECVLEHALSMYQMVAGGHAELRILKGLNTEKAAELETALKERGIIL